MIPPVITLLILTIALTASRIFLAFSPLPWPLAIRHRMVKEAILDFNNEPLFSRLSGPAVQCTSFVAECAPLGDDYLCDPEASAPLSGEGKLTYR